MSIKTEELKTLKDLGEDECGFGREHIDRKELKAEAVKWIKDVREGISFEPIPMPKEEFINNGDMMDGMQNCFKCFFNITEEDLK